MPHARLASLALRLRVVVAVLAVCLALPSTAPAAQAGAASIRLHGTIRDGMVVQRHATVVLRGTTGPGVRVRAVPGWGRTPAVARSDDAGAFEIELRTPEAGGPYEILIEGPEPRVLRDVWVGDVFLVGGQSNAEMPLGDVGPGYRGVRDAEDEIAAADDAMVRVFDVQDGFSVTPLADVRRASTWRTMTPEVARTTSALAWFLARERRERHPDVPVGLVVAADGGTRLEAWMRDAAVARASRRADPDGRLAEGAALVRLAAGDPEALRERERAAQERALAAYRASDPGLAGGWERPGHDDAGDEWFDLEVPGNWGTAPGSGELGAFDGHLWHRRTVEVTDAMLADDGAWTLALGAIDDRDTTWVNGREVGRTEEPNRWNQPRTYPVPRSALRGGRNVIVVRARDTGGGGGMIGPAERMRLVAPSGAAIPLAGTWRARVGLREDAIDDAPAPRARPLVHRNRPTVQWNGLVAPLTDLALAGVAWYQGESNAFSSDGYDVLLETFVADWRDAFGDPDLPIVLVQIAPFRYRGASEVGAPVIRDAQRRVAASDPHTALVVTTDVGDPGDIHPVDKQTVAARTARAFDALAEGAACCGPRVVDARIDGDGRVRVRFDDVAGGFASAGGPLTHWQVRDAEGRWYPARAEIAAANEITLRSRRVSAPTAIRFGWGAAATPNLVGGDGLPASPFEIVVR